MGFVHEALDPSLQRRVALKVVPRSAPTAARKARFAREGRAAARVRHPHVIEIYEVGEHEGLPYLAMELVEGADLSVHLAERGRLTVAETCEILLPIISAVGAAHRAGVVHRDIKPSNVLLGRDHRGKLEPKLVDFGISKLSGCDGEPSLTTTQGPLGTAAYMAPEQVRDAKHADARTDQYALAVLLYECITGHKPFRGSSSYEIMHAVLTAPVEQARSIVADLPSEVNAIIARAMQRDAEKRFSLLGELGRALLPFASEQTRARYEEDFAIRSPASGRGPATIDGLPEPRSEEKATTLTTIDGTLLPVLHRPTAMAGRGWAALALLATMLAAVVAFAHAQWAARRPSQPPRPVGIVHASEALLGEAPPPMVHASPQSSAAAEMPPAVASDRRRAPAALRSPSGRDSDWRGAKHADSSALSTIPQKTMPVSAAAPVATVEFGRNGAPIVE